jgi:hypothetical protein
MSGYFGTELQKGLQARAEASADWIRETPGACQSGRLIGCDDIERLGWDVIEEILERDGVCSFRMIPVAQLDDLAERLAKIGFRLDTWDVFSADRSTAMAAATAILSRGLPDGFTELETPRDPEDPQIVSMQRLMSECGVVPFSGSLLTGEVVAGTMSAVKEPAGAIAAVAYGYFPHNAFSPYHRQAWGGLVAVAESQRGKKLGSIINAMMVRRVFTDLEAEGIYELVGATNLPSRKMVEACGLRLDPSVKCGSATGGERFTR